MNPKSTPPQGVPIPRTPAGRLAVVKELLSPDVVETCPTCGHEKLVPGEPLISAEDARLLLEVDLDPLRPIDVEVVRRETGEILPPLEDE